MDEEEETVTNNETSEKKNNKTIVIILGLIIVLLLGLLLYLFFTKDNNEMKENNNSNMGIQKEVLIRHESGYYVVYVNGGTYLYDKNDKQVVLFKNEKLDVQSIFVNDESVGITTNYNESGCIDSSKPALNFLYIIGSNNDVEITSETCGEDSNDEQQPVDDDTQNSQKNSSSVEKNVYKSKDNKVTLKIVDKNDKDARTAAKNIWLSEYRNLCKEDKDYFSGSEEGITCDTLDKSIDNYLNKTFFNNEHIIKFGYYNNKIIVISDYSDNDENYLIANGDDVNGGAQCHMYYFLINKKNNTIERYNEGYYDILKTSKGYYYTISSCELSLPKVYTKDFKYIGGYLSGPDSDGNIYVSKDNRVIKYDINGKELAKSDSYKQIGGSVLVNNVLYYLVDDNDYMVQLVNFNTKEQIKVNSHKEIIEERMKQDENLKSESIYDYEVFDFEDEMKYEKGIITFEIIENEYTYYTYNVQTKELKKK